MIDMTERHQLLKMCDLILGNVSSSPTCPPSAISYCNGWGGIIDSVVYAVERQPTYSTEYLVTHVLFRKFGRLLSIPEDIVTDADKATDWLFDVEGVRA